MIDDQSQTAKARLNEYLDRTRSHGLEARGLSEYDIRRQHDPDQPVAGRPFVPREQREHPFELPLRSTGKRDPATLQAMLDALAAAGDAETIAAPPPIGR